MKKNYLKFWGVRGSLARPARSSSKYGGNTPCLEIRFGNELIICDTGTGIYDLGVQLEKSVVNATILYSHYHWDHILGLPFFRPIYGKKNKFTIIGREGLKTALKNLLHAPNFPIKYSDFGSKIRLVPKKEGRFKIGKIEIFAFDVNHPNGAFGYRMRFPSGKDVVFMSDCGPQVNTEHLISKISGAGILIHDAQLLPEEFLAKRKFGHSTYLHVLDLARKAQIEKIILFHHDPSRTDRGIDDIERSARTLAKKIGLHAKIFAAREGMIIDL